MSLDHLPNRCPDCRRPVSEGYCTPCVIARSEGIPEDACEDCGTPLYGAELRWAEDNDSPVCRDCAAKGV